jgi:phosphopantothenoylcysteine decarboxylase / phosphopantothenate---cysteine ligase
MLTGKKIILGVSGSIAAYKSVYLLRGLVRSGATVKVVMTKSAASFVSPLTFSTLSKNEVTSELSSEDQWNDHVDLGLWADLLIIAPATANTLAKMAAGICDNLLTAVYLSAKCPVCIAPAMDLDMWDHPVTQENISRLKHHGVQLINVEYGELASGLEGHGRMAEPERITDWIEAFFNADKPLSGQTFVVTAGPTQEAIDPVRFITNHSSGKMGVAIADSLASAGALVHLVLGPGHIRPENKSIVVHHIESAQQMYNAVTELASEANGFVMAAAVADYTPESYSSQKIKKSDAASQLKLKRTQDIAKWVGDNKKKDQLLIGFALETDNALANARAKRTRKKMDLIVLNSLEDSEAGFGYDTNKVTLIDESGEYALDVLPKSAVAQKLVDWIVERK